MPMVPTTANGQPAFGMYLRGADGTFRPFQLHVLALGGPGVRHVTSFFDTGLFATFDLPAHLPPKLQPVSG